MIELKFIDKNVLLEAFSVLNSALEINPAAERQQNNAKQMMIFEAILEI